jgi:phosphoribosyl-AMP cyclohydrolase
MNVAKTLMTRHIPYGVVTGKNLAELYDYQVIVLPEIVALNEAEKEALRQYVASGGSVYASRHTSWTTEKGEASGDFGLADLFGVSYTGETVEKITYMSPTPEGAACFPDSTDCYPMFFSGPQVQLAAHEGVEVWAKLTLPFTVPTDNNRYAVGTSNPPGIHTELPALVLNRYGQGKAMYSAGDFERMTENQQRDVFAELVRSLMSGPPLFATNAPKPVEITMFHQPGQQRYIVSLINFQSDMPNIPIHDIELEIRWSGDRKVDRLLLLPAETETAYTMRDGYVRFSAPRLDTFLMFALCYSE